MEREESCVAILSGITYVCWFHLFYLPSKDSTQADDDQDVEDGWAYDGAHADVSFGDENTFG